MEFDIDVKHGVQGHVEITDYSKEYNQYYAEDALGMSATDKFKYSLSRTINTIMKVNYSSIELTDVFLDNHNKDKEVLQFDVKQDGYYVVNHFVLPTAEWLERLINTTNNILINYSVIYYIDGSTIYKRTVTSEYLGNSKYEYSLGDETEVTIRELMERNLEGTTIQKCLIDIFYTGFLQECYVNHCKELFDKLTAHCRPNCLPKEADPFARDFLWMTLNVIDYLIERSQYLEALRILEEINYCGGFCNNVTYGQSGCNLNVARGTCGCSKG